MTEPRETAQKFADYLNRQTGNHCAYQVDVHDFQNRGEALRRAAGINGTAGDAQDVPHRFVADQHTGACLLCGLARSYRKHSDDPPIRIRRRWHPTSHSPRRFHAARPWRWECPCTPGAFDHAATHADALAEGLAHLATHTETT